MKILKAITFMALFTLCLVHVNAQAPASLLNEPDYNKPKLFSDLPEKLTLNLTNMETLLSLSVGASVNTLMANGFPLIGTVVSKSNPKDATVKSVVIKSRTRQGAVLTFTRITAADGTISYIGRLISKDAGDAFQIVKESGQYVFRKQGLYDLINE
jgi:hypothetical protein